jgi:hypothetical protein
MDETLDGTPGKRYLRCQTPRFEDGTAGSAEKAKTRGRLSISEADPAASSTLKVDEFGVVQPLNRAIEA